MILIIIILIVISGISEAICDILQHKYDISIFKNHKKCSEQYWNPLISWQNKYVTGSKIKKKLFLTVLVFITDAWHLFKTIKTFSEYSVILLIILFFNSNFLIIISIIISKIFMKIIFEIFYSKILIRK